jgi:beta-barrel assembly-enhancing protease
MIVVLLQGIAAARDDRRLRDISAIGTRDIGCNHGLGSRYTLEEQTAVGRSYAEKVETNSKLITDPAITEYVNRIGQNLVHNSDAQVRFTFKIIDNGDINAFSLPGGFIFVDSGLILAADNEAELAGVIAHEIAHVAACHAAQEMARQELADAASMPLIFRIAMPRMTRNTIYSKPDDRYESEADFVGLEYLYQAGYDPQALSSFFEKIMTIDRQKRDTHAQAFEPRSEMAVRIVRSQREIKAVLPPASQYKVDTSDFQEIKRRLSGLEHRTKEDKNTADIVPLIGTSR